MVGADFLHRQRRAQQHQPANIVEPPFHRAHALDREFRDMGAGPDGEGAPRGGARSLQRRPSRVRTSSRGSADARAAALADLRSARRAAPWSAGTVRGLR